MTTSLVHPRSTSGALRHLELRAVRWLARYSVTLLRLSLGAVFFGFGILKFVPGLSPAEPLAARTLDILTFGLVPTQVALIGVAALETSIGILLLAGRWLRLALVLLAFELVGILSPVVLLPSEMFRGLFAPTLEGQYVLKDVIVVAAGLVVAARALGARMVVDRPSGRN
jgi:putative oxidoreductase